MIRKLIGGIVLVGIVWGVGTWAGDGNPMPSPAWFYAVRGKVESLINYSGKTTHDKVPESGFTLPGLDGVLSPASTAPQIGVGK